MGHRGQAGLTSLSPFILCIIGEVISGPLNDYIVSMLLTKTYRNISRISLIRSPSAIVPQARATKPWCL